VAARRGGRLEQSPAHFLSAAACLTRRKEVPADDYYAAIARNPLALKVKLADIADNSDPARLQYLPVEVVQRLTQKYAHALLALGAGPLPASR